VKPAPDDLEARRPVWDALSSLFLDTDTSLLRSWRVSVLAPSPYSIEELERILLDEVYPVCSWNLLDVAGEWAGFDPEWLESSILRRLESPFRLGFPTLGKLIVRSSGEWRHAKDAVLEQRAQDLATRRT
jgi:hypothetical protein